jgi:hypothetical protein
VPAATHSQQVTAVTSAVTSNDERSLGLRRIDAPRPEFPAARRLWNQPTEEERIEEMFRMTEDDRMAAGSTPSRDLKVDWVFTFACAASNLMRMRNLSGAAVQPGQVAADSHHRNSKQGMPQSALNGIQPAVSAGKV